ncbi:hypothetical protein HDU98_000789, partial [Podochytrium sp. JEL0797]
MQRLTSISLYIGVVTMLSLLFFFRNLPSGPASPPTSQGHPNTHPTALDDQRKPLPNILDEFNLPILTPSDTRVPLSQDSTLLPPINSAIKVCPKWEPYDTRMQITKVFPTWVVDGFEIQMCVSDSLCGQGYFVVSRSDKVRCAKELEMVVSNNTSMDKYLKERIGPDAFQVIFNGPERASPAMWLHLGNCEYKLPFRLINPGKYTVSLYLAWESFRAVRESTHDWGQPTWKNMVEDKFEIDVCPECPKFSAKRLEEMVEELPVCSRVDPQQGVYLRMTEETERERYKLRNYGHPYTWEPLGCRFDQRFELHSNDACLNRKNTSIEFFGDSQLRGVWFGVEARLLGSKDPYNNIKHHFLRAKFLNPQDVKGYPETPSKIDFSEGSDELPVGTPRGLVGVDIKLRNSEHMNIFTELGMFKGGEDTSPAEKELMDRDVAVLNTAQHPASGMFNGGHFTTQRYEHLLEYASDYAQFINGKRASYDKAPLEFIWLGNNGIYTDPDLNSGAAKSKDWRTNYRMKIWGDFAERVLRRTGWKMINSFEHTFPWLQESPDHAHMHTTPALDAQVDKLLHKLNLCGARI